MHCCSTRIAARLERLKRRPIDFLGPLYTALNVLNGLPTMCEETGKPATFYAWHSATNRIGGMAQ